MVVARSNLVAPTKKTGTQPKGRVPVFIELRRKNPTVLSFPNVDRSLWTHSIISYKRLRQLKPSGGPLRLLLKRADKARDPAVVAFHAPCPGTNPNGFTLRGYHSVVETVQPTGYYSLEPGCAESLAVIGMDHLQPTLSFCRGGGLPGNLFPDGVAVNIVPFPVRLENADGRLSAQEFETLLAGKSRLFGPFASGFATVRCRLDLVVATFCRCRPRQAASLDF